MSQHISPTTQEYTLRVTVELLGPVAVTFFDPDAGARLDAETLAADTIAVSAPLDVLSALAQQAGKPASAIANRMIGIEWTKARDAERRAEDADEREAYAP